MMASESLPGEAVRTRSLDVSCLALVVLPASYAMLQNTILGARAGGGGCSTFVDEQDASIACTYKTYMCACIDTFRGSAQNRVSQKRVPCSVCIMYVHAHPRWQDSRMIKSHGSRVCLAWYWWTRETRAHPCAPMHATCMQTADVLLYIYILVHVCIIAPATLLPPSLAAPGGIC